MPTLHCKVFKIQNGSGHNTSFSHFLAPLGSNIVDNKVVQPANSWLPIAINSNTALYMTVFEDGLFGKIAKVVKNNKETYFICDTGAHISNGDLRNSENCGWNPLEISFEIAKQIQPDENYWMTSITLDSVTGDTFNFGDTFNGAQAASSWGNQNRPTGAAATYNINIGGRRYR
jgi:hypothetical protein